MTTTVALAFHAEKLHDDRVWQRVAGVARWMARRGIRATFFVYPFRAHVAGRDITDRVRPLVAWGHEIGQHTHFYAGAELVKSEKADDFSEANVVRCLKRDYETLRRMGYRPKGFTAGAWIVNEIVLDTLLELGFAYDCSARFTRSAASTCGPHHRWLQRPHQYANNAGSLLCLPTTCSLGEWFKWGRKVTVDGAVPYQLVSLHDYDLLTLRNFLLWQFLAMMKGKDFVSTENLVKRLRKEEFGV